MDSDDVAFVLVDQLISEHGLSLQLYGPESGYWYADLSFPERDANFGEGYIRAPTRAEALRLAVERAEEALGVSEN